MARSYTTYAKLASPAAEAGTTLGNGGSAWTVAARIKSTAATGSGQYPIICTAYPASGSIPFQISIDGTRTALESGYYTGSAWVVARAATSTFIQGRIYDVVGRLDGSTMQLWINGVLVDIGSGGAWVGRADQEVRIGQRWDGITDYFPGIIEDVCFWNTPLTANEIIDLYNGKSPLEVQNTSLRAYWPLNDYGASGQAYDRGPKGHTLSMTNAIGLTAPLSSKPLRPANDVVPIIPRIPGQIIRGAFRNLVADAAAYDALIMSKKPVSYWPLDDPSGSYLDRTVTANHFTSTTGNARARPSDLKPGFRVPEWAGAEGASSGVQSMTVIDNLTIECWFKPITISAIQQVVMYNGNSGANGYGLTINTSGTLQGLCGGVAFMTTSTNAARFGVWSHFVLKREAGTWTYWINGVKDPITNSTVPVTPGSGVTGPGVSPSHSRQMSRIAYYDRPLNDGEIMQHYMAGVNRFEQTLPLGGGQSIMGAFVIASSVSSPAGVLS